MHQARKFGRDKVIISEHEHITKCVVGHLYATRNARCAVRVAGDVVVELSAGKRKHRQGERVVHRDGHRHVQDRLYPEDKNSLCILLSIQTAVQHYQHEKRCRNGDVGLINRQAQNHHARADWQMQSAAARKLVHREDGQQKRQRIGAACEHEAEGARERGKRKHYRGDEHLHGFALHAEQVYHHAHGTRNKQNTDKSVQPRQRPVREQKL